MGIAAIANVFNDAKALPGWLECASQWADHITLYHTGPQGELSTDGTIEIAKSWGVDLQFGSIDEGFGVVRTKMITMTPCDWVWIGDADERFYRTAPRLLCSGTESYPQVAEPKLSVRNVGTFDQLDVLRRLMTPDVDAVCAVRRHWFNMHNDKPCQNWFVNEDWQLRIIRNCEHVVYRADVRMHEQILDARTGQAPTFNRGNVEDGPFYDHYHCFFKPMETQQRLHDIAVYNAIHEGRVPPTSEQFIRANSPEWDGE